MNSVVVLWEHEVQSALRRWSIIVPSLFSGLLGMLVLAYGFRSFFHSSSYYLTFATGWISYAMVLTGVTAGLTATLDLTTQRIRYLLSLPVPPGAIVLGRLWGATAVTALISTVLLAFAEPLILRFSFSALVAVFAVLVIQALSVVGLVTALTYLVRDISKLGIAASIATGVLQYVSSVYFPPSVFPSWARPLVYVNPLTHAVDFMRALLAQSSDHLALVMLIGETTCLVGLGYALMRRALLKASD